MRLQTRFRGMRGIPHFLLLSSVLVLLAFALFPVIAHAGCSTAACLNYEVEGAPTLESEPSVGAGGHRPDQKSEGSGRNGTRQAAVPEAGDKGPGSDAGTRPDSHKPQQKSTSHHRGGRPSAGGGSKANGNGVGGGEERAATKPAPSHGTGGSSPVLPILISVAVLAAISIGLVVYRQRRSGESPRPT